MHTITIPLTQAQHNFSTAIKALEEDKQVVLTRYGKKLAILSPYNPPPPKQDVLTILRKKRIKLPQPVNAVTTMRELRDAE